VIPTSATERCCPLVKSRREGEKGRKGREKRREQKREKRMEKMLEADGCDDGGGFVMK
jgi:hypothetical protein